MDKELKREATRFNLFSEYDLGPKTWEVNDGKIGRIAKKEKVTTAKIIEEGGAWSYPVNAEVLVDLGDNTLHTAMIVDRREGSQYGIQIKGSSQFEVVNEADIVSSADLEDIF